MKKDDIRLLYDIQTKIREQENQRFNIRDNYLNGIAVVSQTRIDSINKDLSISFYLNGKEYGFNETIDHLLTEEEARKKLIDSMANTIALLIYQNKIYEKINTK